MPPTPLQEEGTTRLTSQVSVPPRVALVRVLDDSCNPPVFRLHDRPCVVGSGPDADLVVHARAVSRRHAVLSLVPEGVLVEDLESTNGTFYLGHKVEKLRVSLGATLMLGSTRVVLESEEDSESVSIDTSRAHSSTYEQLARELDFVASSSAMCGVLAIIDRLRNSTATVLVAGESGVGKEVVAAALHRTSPVAKGPFVAINCGAISRDLIASELFGHVRGAFTGASEARHGAFASAHDGTLFLDEIGELPLDVQPTLLRAIETGEIRAVGSDRTQRVRVRLIAATNRDLAARVVAGSFREDLYYRMVVVPLVVPPLRERREDIEPLALAFARSVGLQGLSSTVVEQLKAHSWPGNARELRNTIVAYAALGNVSFAPVPSNAPAPLPVDPDRPYTDQRDELCDRFTRAYLEDLLLRAGGNLSKAARMAKLDRSYLGRLLTKAGVGNR